MWRWYQPSSELGREWSWNSPQTLLSFIAGLCPGVASLVSHPVSSSLPSTVSSVPGFWQRVWRALAGERVCLPAHQPAAVCPARGADWLGRTPGILPVRPLPHWHRETELQVCFLSSFGLISLCSLSRNQRERNMFQHFINWFLTCQT